MLLACGVYPLLVNSVADLTTSRIEKYQLLTLATVGVSAVSAASLLAPVLGSTLDRYPVAMYSLFLGLTLGGLPLLWQAVKPADRTTVFCAIVAFGTMAILETISSNVTMLSGSESSPQYLLLFSSGVLGGAAMILPGLSGAYILLILGQYRTVVGAISLMSEALRHQQWSALMDPVGVLLPFGLGVAFGIFGVSNVVKLLLERYRRQTFGFLFGLLLGAVISLWPFTDSVPPELGDVVGGQVMSTPEMLLEVEPSDHKVVNIFPSLQEFSSAAVLSIFGFSLSLGIGKFRE